MRVAIIGNPNTGKTTLFNALTGLRQRVGNYPGVTVAKKSGKLTLHDGVVVEIIDLPGIYSLGAQSLDERVALDVLCNHVADTPPPDALLVVCDVTNLLRNLFLPAQLAELGIPMVIALNHADEARKRGMRVDTQLLSQRLGGVPVVLCSAAHAEGVADVRAALQSLRTNPVKPSRVEWDAPVREAIAKVGEAIVRDAGVTLPEAEVQRVLFDANSPVLERLKWPHEKRDRVIAESREIIRRAGANPFAVEALRHYDRLQKLLVGVVTEGGVEATRTRRIDAVLLHRFWGVVIFLGMMLGMFASVFWLAKLPMGLVELGVDALKEAVGGVAWLADKPMLHDLLVDGAISGVGAFLVFLPQIFILFLFISLLEDTGYMARAAFIMDKLFSWCGLNGKSFVPMLSGFACAVPSIMGTRTIEDPKARVATAFVTPFMSCSARLPVYTLMIGAFIVPRYGTWVATGVMVGMYLVGLVVAIPTAFFITRFYLKVRPQPFVLELPRYQKPKFRDVVWRMWTNGREFVEKAGTVIFAISVIVWALTYFPHDAKLAEGIKASYVAELAHEKNISPEEALKLVEAEPPAAPEEKKDLAWWGSWTSEQLFPAATAETGPPPPNEVYSERVTGAYMENSYLGRFGKTVQPVFDPAGFDWKITVGVLASFPAREVIVSTLGITYSLGDTQDAKSGGLREAMAKSVWQDGPRKGTPIFTIPVVFGLMVFFALCSQCGATLATLAKEAGTRWAVASFLYMTALAWLAAVAVYQIGSRL